MTRNRNGAEQKRVHDSWVERKKDAKTSKFRAAQQAQKAGQMAQLKMDEARHEVGELSQVRNFGISISSIG
jgi:hypothetical protein